MMRSAWECSNVEQIRRELDRIDRELVCTLKLREEYVRKAHSLARRNSTGSLEQCLPEMIEQRRQWAADDGLSAGRLDALCGALGLLDGAGRSEVRHPEHTVRTEVESATWA
jgi:isochorismate pyruvate lyase